MGLKKQLTKNIKSTNSISNYKNNTHTGASLRPRNPNHIYWGVAITLSPPCVFSKKLKRCHNGGINKSNS